MVVALGAALATAAQATEQSGIAPSSTASETTIGGGSNNDVPSTVGSTTIPTSASTTSSASPTSGASTTTIDSTTTPSTVGPTAIPTTDSSAPTVAPDASTTDLRNMDQGPTTLADQITVTQVGGSNPPAADGSPITAATTSTTTTSTTTTSTPTASTTTTSSSTTTSSTTTTLKEASQSAPVRCLFLTTGTGSDTVAAADAPPPAPCKRSDGTWTHGADTVVLGKLRPSGGRARSLSVWALVVQDEAPRTLRFSVRRPDGSTAVAQTTRVGRGINQSPTCEPRPGLIQAIRSTGQLDGETDVAAMCSKPGLALVELPFELANQSACGTYSVVALTDEELAKPLLMTFTISCAPQLTVEFDRLDLPDLPAGSTVLKGDQRTAGNQWIVRNTGDTPFELQATFSPTSGDSLSPSDTLLSASLRLKTEAIGKPAITLCPGQSAVLDIVAIVAPSAPSGGFSSSLSFSVTTKDEAVLCS